MSDGSSDRMLLPVIDWLIYQVNPTLLAESTYADLSVLKKSPKTLVERINSALKSYPCDILFIHRDAEKKSYEVRKDEISRAWTLINQRDLDTVGIAVIPVRMSEAWLLTDRQAIKEASGNPNSKIKLNLPKLSQLENIPNPKKTLLTLIEKASGLREKRLRRLNTHQAIHLVAEYTEDFSPLRQLSAFQKLEEDIKNTLTHYRTL